MTQRYQEVDRQAWNHLANRGWPSTRPYGPHHFAHARELLAPYGWIPWETVTRVLCLGAGGGQQAPLLAALGCRVTAVDLCPEQLERDRAVADQYGLEIELVEGDMLDLSPLHGCEFDLVYQALSACYVPDVRQLYREVARVLKPGGYYRAEHANPVTMQLPDLDAWDGKGYRLVRPQLSSQPVSWMVPGFVSSNLRRSAGTTFTRCMPSSVAWAMRDSSCFTSPSGRRQTSRLSPGHTATWQPTFRPSSRWSPDSIARRDSPRRRADASSRRDRHPSSLARRPFGPAPRAYAAAPAPRHPDAA